MAASGYLYITQSSLVKISVQHNH